MNATLSDDGRLLSLSGPLSEKTDLQALAARLSGEVRVDASGIARINSAGVKAWSRFIGAVPAGVTLVFEKCPVVFVSQLNMVAGFIGGGRVASLAVPYLCPSCGEAVEPVLTLEQAANGLPESHGPCPKCGKPLELDVMPDEYLAFLRG